MKIDKAAKGKQVRITPQRRVTMTDVANLAGCSQSTVSIVLNNAPGITIARATRERVRKAAETLGYSMERVQTSYEGMPPVLRAHRKIAVIFDYLATSPEAVEAVEGLRLAAWPSAYVVASYQTANDPKMTDITLQAALNAGIDAIVFATIMTREVKVPSQLYTLGIPVVLLNCYSPDRHFPSVLPGEVAGGHLATRTLTAAGHRRIAHITGEMWMDAAKNRLKGYRQALSSADIPFDPALVRNGNWQVSSGYEHAMALLKSDNPPTAIFCSNDRMAFGAYEAIKELGLRIPDDISVMGYDDQEIARHLSPPLTTLILPHRDMGAWAFDTISHMQNAGLPRDQYPLVKLECTLVERASVAGPKVTTDRLAADINSA